MRKSQKINNFKKVVFSVVLFLSFTGFSLAKDDAKKSVKKEDVNKFLKSPEDFEKAVKDEVKRRLLILKKGEFVKITNELFDKELKLKEEILVLKKKENLLENSKVSLQKQIKNFHKEQQKYLSCRSEVSEKHDKRIRHMVDVISGMKPLTASQILSVQDTKIAIDILSKLEAVKVSKIFNLMDKEISAKLQKQYMTMKE